MYGLFESHFLLGRKGQVGIAIYDPYTRLDKLSGMQVTGKAELVQARSEEYFCLLSNKKISVESLTHPHLMPKNTSRGCTSELKRDSGLYHNIKF